MTGPSVFAAESVEGIVNWHPSFAFEHTLHYVTETLERLPTWQEFRMMAATDAAAREMIVTPAERRTAELAAAGINTATIKAAMQWRVGNAYLAFLKEYYVVALLREVGLDARYHILADVLLRVDCWIKDTCVSVYLGNPRFRAGMTGRKPPPSQILGTGGPFSFVALELGVRREFGTVHLPDRSEVVRLADTTLAGPISPERPARRERPLK